jgi:hypothetical protein
LLAERFGDSYLSLLRTTHEVRMGRRQLKLGFFSPNCSGGMSVTKVPERWVNSWDNNIRLAKLADEAGIEFLLPIARWIGYGGETDFHGSVLETLTWATGLLAHTERINIFATVHTAFIHPVAAAKQLATADQLGRGRLGLVDRHRALHRQVGRGHGERFVNRSRRVLILGGVALAIIGMCHGTWYAVFAEHQALDRIGGSLATAFTKASERNVAQATVALGQYREAKYVYERQVDAHGHWIGLAMLLIVLGLAFDRVAFTERQKLVFALALLAGATLFPLTVLLQTFSHGPVPRILTVASSALMIAALGITALGFRAHRPSA